MIHTKVDVKKSIRLNPFTCFTYRINVSIDIFMNSNSTWLSIRRRRTFSYPAYMNGRVGHFIAGRSWLVEEVNDFFIIKLQKLRRYLCSKYLQHCISYLTSLPLRIMEFIMIWISIIPWIQEVVHRFPLLVLA